MKTIEDIELINDKMAQFIGWEKQEDPKEKFFGEWFIPGNVRKKMDSTDFDIDWNLLMMVVDKIETLDHSVQIGGELGNIIDYTKYKPRESVILGRSDIDKQYPGLPESLPKITEVYLLCSLFIDIRLKHNL